MNLNGIEYANLMLPLLLELVETISKNGWNIYEWNQINQTLLVIDFDWTFLNG